MANIIRQLSSLSRHAEEMFGNLFKEAEAVASRSSNIQARIDRLAIRVTQLDSTVEEGMSQCGNFMIFLSLGYYVESILGVLEVQNMLF